MLKEILTPHGSVLPQVALVLFVLIAALVIFYISTDRRRDHRKRMESMPLDDGTDIKPADTNLPSARKDAP
jgi:hypothetical protein